MYKCTQHIIIVNYNTYIYVKYTYYIHIICLSSSLLISDHLCLAERLSFYKIGCFNSDYSNKQYFYIVINLGN